MIDQTAAKTAFKALDIMERRIKELKAENVRLRQQRDAANAQLDFLIENAKDVK